MTSGTHKKRTVLGVLCVAAHATQSTINSTTVGARTYWHMHAEPNHASMDCEFARTNYNN